MPHTREVVCPALFRKPAPSDPPPVRTACLMLAIVGALGMLGTCGLLGGCGLSPAATTGGSRAGGGATSVTTSVTMTVGPDDGPAPVLGAIRGARHRLMMEMYMLTSPESVSALIAAHGAGVEVRVLLEPAPFGDADANGAAFAALAAAGVDVRWTSRSQGLVHTKLLISDDRVATIMSLNLTTAGLALNREYAVADTNVADVRWAQAIWNADAVGGDPGTPPPGTRVIASPIDARARLTAALEGARATIALEMEELSDADMVSRLKAAAGRGVAVTVVAPAADASAATTAALRALAAAGCTVRVLPTPTVHAKAMAVDQGLPQRLGYVGSINFTRASLDDNREVGVLFDTPVATARVAATIGADAAAGRPP